MQNCGDALNENEMWIIQGLPYLMVFDNKTLMYIDHFSLIYLKMTRRKRK